MCNADVFLGFLAILFPPLPGTSSLALSHHVHVCRATNTDRSSSHEQSGSSAVSAPSTPSSTSSSLASAGSQASSTPGTSSQSSRTLTTTTSRCPSTTSLVASPTSLSTSSLAPKAARIPMVASPSTTARLLRCARKITAPPTTTAPAPRPPALRAAPTLLPHTPRQSRATTRFKLRIEHGIGRIRWRTKSCDSLPTRVVEYSTVST